MATAPSRSVQAVGMSLLRVVVCILLIAAITWIAFSLLKITALIVGFAYVLAVLAVAARWGLTESVVTSLVATLCLNYFFFPPILSITIADPQNWVALFAFMVTAITASQLSASVRSGATEAQARRVEVESLYQLSLSLLQADATKELGLRIAESIQKQFDCIAVAFCDRSNGAIYRAGSEDQSLDEEKIRALALGNEAWSLSRNALLPAGIEFLAMPVALEGRVLGSLGLIGTSFYEPALQAVANLAAVAIERARQQAALDRMEVARQNERLRSILLDALAHEFLTPLTSIKSAITAVRSEYTHEAEEGEFLAVVEEEADKLGEIINETTDMARIELGNLRLRRRQMQVLSLIEPSLVRMKTLLEGHKLYLRIQDDLSAVYADPEMIGLALRQLLGNAVKYSPPETDLVIYASQTGDTVTIRIRDWGPGIPTDELELVFERFYRGKKTQESVAGTGMGLSIARDIFGAHQGRLWVENAAGGGAQFSFTLPVYSPSYSEEKEP